MGARLFEIADREVAHADIPDLAGAVERFEGLHRLPQRDLAPRVRPVHLIEVDLANPEALQARGACLLHVVAPEAPESQKPIEARGRTIPADGRADGTARTTCCIYRASDRTPRFPSGTPSRRRTSLSIRSRP